MLASVNGVVRLKINLVCMVHQKYKVFSKSNASYFIMLAHDSRRECWWYGSRSWTFPPVFHYILLLYNWLQQKGSLIKWHLTWKCVWRKGVELNSSLQKKCHSLTFINICQMLLETKQWMWAQWGSGWCVSAVATATVCLLHWCRFLWVGHAGFCSSLVKLHR